MFGVPSAVERRADGADLAVHHAAGGHDMGPGLGLGDGDAGVDLERGVVVDRGARVAGGPVEHAAVAVIGVLVDAINLVVYQGSYSLKGMGELISRSASRLDAFSGYPIRT